MNRVATPSLDQWTGISMVHASFILISYYSLLLISIPHHDTHNGTRGMSPHLADVRHAYIGHGHTFIFLLFLNNILFYFGPKWPRRAPRGMDPGPQRLRPSAWPTPKHWPLFSYYYLIIIILFHSYYYSPRAAGIPPQRDPPSLKLSL